MNRTSRPRARTSLTSLLRHRPALERLEPRLPPGDAVLGLLLAWPDLASPIASGLDHDLISPFESVDTTPSFVTHRQDAIQEPDGGAAPSEARPSHSTDQRAIELIPASRPASINPASLHASALPAPDTTSTIENATHSASRIPALAASRVFGNPAPAGTPILPTGPTIPTLNAGTESKASENYGNLPLTFEANHGQTDASVDFIARTGAGTVFVTPTAAVFALQNSVPLSDRVHATVANASGSESRAGTAIHMQIVGANPDAQPTGVNRQPGIVNYFIGNDPNQWHANIPTFGGVQYDDVYPGIDLAYYGNNGQLEYDFIVSPGADPNVIALNFAGADGVEIDAHGALVMHTGAGDVVQQKPYIYQEINGTRQQVDGQFAIRNLQSAMEVSFDISSYDPAHSLVIDPLVLGYSTYLGGALGSDLGYGIAVDATGNTYVTGPTQSTNFPTTPGAFDTSHNGQRDAFVAKLSADGANLIYSTYLGGSEEDGGYGIAVDAADNTYITGYTYSTNFPTTSGAFGSHNGGGADAFVVKLSTDGSNLVYGTYLGGSSNDLPYGRIAVDAAGNAYVGGGTTSPNFPTTPGAFDTSLSGNSDAFVAKLSADGSSLVYGTLLGGSGYDYSNGIAVDPAGYVYITGSTPSTDFPTTPGAFDTSYNGSNSDAFVARLVADGSSLAYSTFLGGSSNDFGDAIAVDATGNTYVTGQTQSANFPTTPGAFDPSHNGVYDAFVAKLTGDGTGLVVGTYLGGSGDDGGFAIAVEAAGNAYVTGETLSTNFPTTPGAFDTSYNGDDAFVAKLGADGISLGYGTYLGGSNTDIGNGIAVDVAGNAYVAGETFSTNFPTTPGVLKRRNRGDSDAFVTKFAEV